LSVTTHLTHTFQTDVREYTVPATSPVPGLLVYEIPDEVEPLSGLRWSLGHHSGLLIASAMYEDDAIRGAHKIADMANWTKNAADLRGQVDQDRLYERLAWVACESPAYT
jgi:hypothetical protein